MPREAKLIITSENKAEPGIKDAIRSVVGLDQAVEKVGNTIKSAFTVLAVFEGLKKLTQFSLDSVKAFGEMERSMLQLEAAIGGNEASFGRLTGLIDDMAGKTLSSKDEIEGLVAELASLGRSDDEIEKITRAAVNLSNVTGKSLNEAFTSLNATYTGTGGKLEKLIPEIGNLTEAQLKAGGATDLVNTMFQTLSDTMATGVSQRLSNLGKGFDDLRENLGSRMLGIFDPIIQGITGIVDKWNAAFEAQKEYHDALISNSALAEAIEKQRAAQEAVSTAFPIYNTARAQAASIGQKIKPELEAYYRQLVTDLQNANTELQILRQAPSGSGGRPLGLGGSTPGSPGAPPSSGAGYQGAYIDGFGRYRQTPNMSPGPELVSLAQALSDIGWGLEGGGLGLGSSGGGLGAEGSRLAGDSGAGRYRQAGASGYHGAYIKEEAEKTFDPLGQMLDKLEASFGGINVLTTALNKVFQGVMNILGPAIDKILTPIFNVLTSFGEQIGEALLPLFEFLGETILPVVMFNLKGLAVALEVLMSPVRFLADLFKWLGQAMQDFFFNLTNPIWESDRETSAFSSDAFTGLADRIAAIWANDYTKGTAARASTYTMGGASGGGGATYTGGQTITFNFYNQGNVVGSGGLQELAVTIDGLIKQNARYA